MTEKGKPVLDANGNKVGKDALFRGATIKYVSETFPLNDLLTITADYIGQWRAVGSGVVVLLKWDEEDQCWRIEPVIEPTYHYNKFDRDRDRENSGLNRKYLDKSSIEVLPEELRSLFDQADDRDRLIALLLKFAEYECLVHSSGAGSCRILDQYKTEREWCIPCICSHELALLKVRDPSLSIPEWITNFDIYPDPTDPACWRSEPADPPHVCAYTDAGVECKCVKP